MKKLGRFLVVGACFGLVHSSYAKTNQSNVPKHIPGEFIVKLKKGYSIPKFKQASQVKKLQTQGGNFFKLRTQNNKGLQLNILELQSLEGVEYAEPNYLYFPQVLPQNVKTLLEADASFDQLWGLKNTGTNEPTKEGDGYTDRVGVPGVDIDAIKAWEISKGSSEVKIAIIDTGIDYNHPDLQENIFVNEAEIPDNGIDDDENGFVDDYYGYNFLENNNDPMDQDGHGTHCAGTIGAVHNEIGVAGVMSEVKLLPIRFLGAAGGSTEGAIQAIDYAVSRGVNIMSNSWGGGSYSEALKEAIERANEAGILFVAAAGNSGTDNDTSHHYPSDYQVDNIVSVAAHSIIDSVTTFSCYGNETVHLAAPGRNILSSVPGGEYKVYSGTSMATPHVSGALGLLFATHPEMSASEAKERLLATTEGGVAYRGSVISKGRLNVYNLIENIRPEKIEDPAEDLWEDYVLDEPFIIENYTENMEVENVYQIEGAKHIRVVIDSLNTEKGYDKILVSDGQGTRVDSQSGSGTMVITQYIDGDTIQVKFTSDESYNRQGFSITKLQVIK